MTTTEGDHDPFLAAAAAAGFTPEADVPVIDPEYMNVKKALRHRRVADRELDADEFMAGVGARPKMSMTERMAQDRPATVIDKALAAEVNLLGGPSAAGKSLIAREMALCVGSGEPWLGHDVPEARNVLWLASEGTHDLAERWRSHHLWDAAEGRLWLMEEPFNLLLPAEVDWLLSQYADERPGLVVLDVIYGFGVNDESSKDVLPAFAAMKKIAAAWGCAVLAIGHTGHDETQRRFRGSSVWRQLSAVEWHAAEGVLTCEKSKLAAAEALRYPYEVMFPLVRWIGSGEELSAAAAAVYAGMDKDRRTMKAVLEICSEPPVPRTARTAPKAGWSDTAVCHALRDRHTRKVDPEDVHVHRGTYVAPVLETLSASGLIQNMETTQRTGAPHQWLTTETGREALEEWE